MNAKTKKLKWYNFRQNNSGGSFTIMNKVDVNVIVQAHSAHEANILAEEIGIYFDGCLDGLDCGCCGDRWSTTYESGGTDKPSIYGKSVGKYSKTEVTTKNSGEWGFDKNQGVKIYPYGTIIL